MTKPRVVLVHPPSKMFPYEVWPPAFDGLDVEIVSVECRNRDETLEAIREADVVMIGGFRVDLSDGAGKLISLGIDVPPTDVGLPRLDVSSKELPAALKTSFGFNVSGDATTVLTAKFMEAKLGDEKKPELTIKGTLEVSCPKKK